jgi:hypothetical protein
MNSNPPTDRSIFDDDADLHAPDPHDGAPPLDDLKKMFREAYTSSEESRELAFRDQDYFDGYAQLDSSVRAKLRKRGQPAIYKNKIRAGVNGILGILDGSTTSPEAVARNENGEDAAVVVTQVLRYLGDKTNIEDVKRICSKEFLINGICASIIETDDDDEARVSAIPYDEFYFDPFSRRYDFKDAQYFIRAKWVDSSFVARKWPHAASAAMSAGSWDGIGQEDRPIFAKMWVDPSRRRLMLVENYYRNKDDGVWMRAVYCHCDVLEFGPSEYLDDTGKRINPIEACSFEVSRDLDRYGMVRDMVPLQDSINGRHSKMLHLTNSSRVSATENAQPENAKLARAEAAKADGVIPYGYEIVNSSTDFQGNLQILEGDTADIERMAPSPALLGRSGGANESGRARQILQQAGMSELARPFSRWEDWEERNWKQMWFRACQFMSQQKEMRVTNNAGVRQSLMVNYPIVKSVMSPVLDPQTGRPQINPQTGQPVMQPQQQQVGVHNQLAQMDVEITISAVRQAQTLRQEAIDAMFEFSAKAGMSPLDPSFGLMLEISDIPDKQELIEKWKAARAQAAQDAAPQQQAQAQAAQATQQVQAQSAQAKTAKDSAQAQRDEALSAKHDMEAHNLAFELSVKEAALRAAVGTGQYNAILDPSALGPHPS